MAQNLPTQGDFVLNTSVKRLWQTAKPALLMFICFVGFAPRALANPEVPLLYDARSVALGGTGAAYLNSAAAGPHNPALLSQIAHTSFTATFTPYVLKLQAPFKLSNTSTMQVHSGAIFGPFTQLALATRLHHRIVIGLNAGLTSAAGGQYDKIPLRMFSDRASVMNGSAKFAVFAGELQLPVAFQITPSISIGAAYRVTYAQALTDVSNVRNQPLSHMSLSGLNFKGFQLGVWGRPFSRAQLGLSYRRNVSMVLHGSMSQPSALKGNVVTVADPMPYLSPHQFRLGADISAWPEHLRVALDVRYYLFHAADPTLQNSLGIQTGVEYNLPHNIQARLGYSLMHSATRPQSANPKLAPPGYGHGVTLGAGIAFSQCDLDVAVGFVTAHTRVRPQDVVQSQSAPGIYGAQGFVGSISATYRLGHPAYHTTTTPSLLLRPSNPAPATEAAPQAEPTSPAPSVPATSLRPVVNPVQTDEAFVPR